MTNASNTSITVSAVVTKEERVEVLAYIESAMRDAFHCNPPVTIGVVCIARENGVIVGSLAIQSSTRDSPFPVEHHYDFDLDNTPFTFHREKIVQAGRWIAQRTGVSLLVLQACSQLAIDFGKRYMLIEAKPYSAKRLCELGYDCRPINGAKLLVESVKASVGEDGMRYYLEEPLPTLYMFPI
jgi:hypothetical protein